MKLFHLGAVSLLVASILTTASAYYWKPPKGPDIFSILIFLFVFIIVIRVLFPDNGKKGVNSYR
ncbi:hypothetical protein DPMN_177050 [Dreissena polymorpha]|uniref:Uncharacterized protein n=1 Tax=Dreissena polymorpha TaxID=45954 RepID=A0A9D4EC34_DREPO|nr:hypothetical protein DPMN_176980 [Dreissena polymorpha]KAH3775644.1 hypothetical protein DPMN_177050 [Dreissena polymorpha]